MAAASPPSSESPSIQGVGTHESLHRQQANETIDNEISPQNERHSSAASSQQRHSPTSHQHVGAGPEPRQRQATSPIASAARQQHADRPSAPSRAAVDPGRQERAHHGYQHEARVDYDIPDSYFQLDDVTPEPPVERSSRDGPLERRPSRRASRRSSRALATTPKHQREESLDYDIPDDYAQLDEVASGPPVERTSHDGPLERRPSRRSSRALAPFPEQPEAAQDWSPTPPPTTASRLATQLYTISYLVVFAILGTLARLGLQSLTTYPQSPTYIPSLWPNFAGCLVMGFLAEDQTLFSQDSPMHTDKDNPRRRLRHEVSPEDKAAHLATKKTIPLYIGLATGFCGSLTSFSAFMRDIFLALSNDLPSSRPSLDEARSGGYSFLALAAVLITTVSLSLGGLILGAHLSLLLAPVTPILPRVLVRRVLDPAAVALAVGGLVVTVVLSALTPPAGAAWPSRAELLALAFAGPGCLARFQASLWLNGRGRLGNAFPLGTFVANVAGTLILAAAWDLEHSPAVVSAVVGCQVLVGVQDGFCGCLTTVSTWVAELAALRRRHAYVYGAVSVAAGFSICVVVMGGLRWSRGFEQSVC